MSTVYVGVHDATTQDTEKEKIHFVNELIFCIVPVLYNMH